MTRGGDDGAASGARGFARERAGVEHERLAEIRQREHDDTDEASRAGHRRYCTPLLRGNQQCDSILPALVNARLRPCVWELASIDVVVTVRTAAGRPALEHRAPRISVRLPDRRIH